MSIPGRLTVGAGGKLTGPAAITWNTPFPTPAGTPGGGSGVMSGVVMHTEVGFEHNVIDEFNNIVYQASAFFSIGTDGHIHQYGPVGANWMAWAQAGGNAAWYSIEHEDLGHPETPLTDAQITASAQLVECLSAFAGFPLAEANHPSERGYGVHSMGGAAWGGHTCPDTGPDHPVRSLQRAPILALARQIRAGAPGWVMHATTGGESLITVARAAKTKPSTILRRTAIREGIYAGDLAAYLNAGNLRAPMKAGISLMMPAGSPPPARVPGAVRSAAAGTSRDAAVTVRAAGRAVAAEPLMTSAGTAALLAAAAALFRDRLGLHLTPVELHAAVTALVAIGGVVATVTTRPVRVGAITTVLGTLAAAAATFGVQVSPAVLGMEIPLATLLAALLMRVHVSPARPPSAGPP